MTCVFCDIANGTLGAARSKANYVRLWENAVAIVPLGPVTPGHVLIIPKKHVANAIEDAKITAVTMRHAAEYAKDIGQCNIITSVGPDATQTVFHLHIHVVPRRPNDGLHLPWTNQEIK